MDNRILLLLRRYQETKDATYAVKLAESLSRTHIRQPIQIYEVSGTLEASYTSLHTSYREACRAACEFFINEIRSLYLIEELPLDTLEELIEKESESERHLDQRTYKTLVLIRDKKYIEAVESQPEEEEYVTVEPVFVDE